MKSRDVTVQETHKDNMSSNQIFDYVDESQSERLARKSKEMPVFPIGIAGLTMACLYGAYKFKNRGSMSPSVFLMQLRVGAQGTVVACLTLGLAYSMCKEYVFDKKPSLAEPK
ncbi:uncharacterized protein CBL_11197 [Carabus blaptoides fortunei]